MDRSTVERILSNATATAFGDAALYVPLVGRARHLSLFVRQRPQVIDGLGAANILADGDVIEIRRSTLEVDPQPGDQVIVGERHLTVRSAKPASSTGTIWLLDCVPAAS